MSRDAYPTKRDLDAAMEKNQGWMGPTFRLPAAQPYVMWQESVTAAVLAERERCAKVCEQANATYGDYFAAAIRKGD
jgi:hypothetical protein